MTAVAQKVCCVGGRKGLAVGVVSIRRRLVLVIFVGLLLVYVFK